MLSRRVVASLMVLAFLSQLAADCSGEQVEFVLGYVELGGRTAVYAPLCAGDEVRGVRVYAAPDPDKGGDFTPLWEVEGPTSDPVRMGLFVLGDNSQFGTVQRQPPATFPRELSVAVDTVRGRIVAEAWEHPADIPVYPAGTPAATMTFETSRGRKSFSQLRELLESQSHACP